MRRALARVFVLVAWASALPASAQAPRREDLGDLIVLHLAGSYEEMGRQQAELLGSELRAVYGLQRKQFADMVSRGPLGLRLLDRLGIPLVSWAGPRYEDSGYFAEIAGIAHGLGEEPREVLRAVFALAWGSTVFVATRSATADGEALIGRNVDWDDAYGLRRPMVVHYRPNQGDLAHVVATWPGIALPTVGLNEAGFALSLNYFATDPQVGMALPQWPLRRALQVARSVEQGIRVFEETRELGLAGFVAMADAQGAIAQVECTPSRCAVFRPEGDWFAQANHARTPEMIPHDLYRSPDSFARQAGMEAALAPHLGRLTPELASEVLRDRGGSPYANAEVVGNLFVLNAVVVQPRAGILWHSTTMQPHAPFGSYVPFRVAGDAGAVPSLPPDPRLANGALDREREAVAELRRAERLSETGDHAAAAQRLDQLYQGFSDVLDPSRLLWARARARWRIGGDAEAFALLERLAAEEAPFEVRAWGLALAGRLAERLGRRDEALGWYQQARAHLAERPEFATYFEDLREEIEADLAAARPGAPLPETPSLLAAPR